MLPTLKAAVFVSALCLLLGVGLSLAHAADAPAAPAPVAGLVIVKAIYGDLPDGPTVDVTEKVRAMVKNQCLSVVANKATFGSPAGSNPKSLKVSYTIDGIARSRTVAESESLAISAHLIIRKAVYGALPNGEAFDVTDTVSNMIKNNSLSVEASNDNFSDPANGSVKSLRVDYTFDGVNKSKTVNEGQTLSISEKGE